MRPGILTSLALMCFTALLFTGCLKDQCDRTHEFIRYDPVYKTLDNIRVNVSVEGPRALKSPGNIYYYNEYLLINERLEGVHIINNSDPANPVNLSFLSIPGNRDIAVQNNVLYADMFIDLVAVDIADIQNPSLLCRVENVFASYYSFSEDQGFIVDYEPTNEVQQIDCSDDRWSSLWWGGGIGGIWFQSSIDNSFATADFAGSGQEKSGGPGIAGSMARFTLAKDHLYTLDLAQMHVFDIGTACPEKKASVDMRWGIETLFPYGDYLFVGSNNGMLIYDNTNAEQPIYLSEFSHAQSCDPVFVSNDIAYVTLRDGSTCNNFINQLDVIDVSTITNPKLIKTYPMKHPHGLSVVNSTLFLCEGEFGFKVFDATDNTAISDNILSWTKDIHAYDVIVLPQSDVAMVIGEGGLYQYDVSDRNSPVEISMIPIDK